MVAVNYHMMEVGLRFPLHHNVTHLLIVWGVAPLQIHPNGWMNLLSLFTWLGKHRLYRLPTPGEVNSFSPCQSQKMSYTSAGWNLLQRNPVQASRLAAEVVLRCQILEVIGGQPWLRFGDSRHFFA